jgi:NTP pyrophosphatase (non-canonical NTP hydrolase)
MDFQDMIQRALTVRRLYSQKESQLSGSPWNSEDIALGFVGDVGDLAKLVMAESGKRKIENSQEKLAHELSDCLWSVIVLAEMHDVNLGQAFMETMGKLENNLLESQE